MGSRQPGQNDKQRAFERGAQRRFVDTWEKSASPDLLALARAASLPHFVDRRLLALLYDGAGDLPQLVDRLTRQRILVAVDDRYFTVQPAVRKRLLERWQADDLDAYRAASGRAARFFYERMHARQDEDLEYVYHLLAVNEGQALQQLAYICEDALARRLSGRAEEVLAYAQEQLPVLSPLAQAWIRYFEARVRLARGQYAQGEAILRTLRADEEDTYLRVQVLMGLAAIYAGSQRWGEALDCYEEAETLLQAEEDTRQLATLYQAQGATYLQLATALGSLQEGTVAFTPRHRRWRKRIQHAPFLAYRWFSRRISFLPNIYFGTNYQDWYIIRVYYEAIGCYEQARRFLSARAAAGETVEPALTDVEIRLADLQHIVGRWQRADEKFRRLAASPVVRADDYRRAVLALALGRAALARNEPAAARDQLRHAYDTFRAYEDGSSATIAGRLLAMSELRLENIDAAVDVYVESGDEARDGNNILAATQIWWILARLRERYPLPEALRARVAALGESLPERAYIARFPGELLQRYRRLAFNFLAPIVFILVVLLGAQTFFGIAVLEAFFSAGADAPPPPIDLAIGLLFVAGIVLMTVWSYELIYVVLGWRNARRLPLADLSEQQPKYLLSRPDTFSVRDGDGQVVERQWAAVQQVISVDRAIWREPIDLFSRFALTFPTGPPLVVEGIFRQYAGLKADAASRSGGDDALPPVLNLDYAFLRSRWSLVALVLSLLMVPLVISDRLDRDYRRPNFVELTPQRTSYAYLVDEEGALRVADIGRPGPPVLVGRVDSAWRATALASAGEYLYVAAGNEGLRVVRTGDPAQPVEVGAVDTAGTVEDVAVDGQYAYIATGPQGMVVVDVSVPESPRVVASAASVGSATQVAARPGRVYLLDEGGLLILEIDDAGSTVELVQRGRWAHQGRTVDLALEDDLAYVVDESQGLFVVDVADPAAAAPVAQLPAPSLRHVALAPPFAYLLAGTGTLQVLDISDPQAVREINRIQAGAPASGLAVAPGLGRAYVGVGGSGLVALKILNPEDAIEEEARLETITPAAIVLPGSIRLPLASVFYYFLRWARLIFPIIGLSRLLVNEYRVKQAVDGDVRLRDMVTVVVALLILSAWLLWEVVNLTR